MGQLLERRKLLAGRKKTYMYFEASEANDQIGITNYGSNAPVLYYSSDQKTWTLWDYSTITLSNVGDRVYFYGTDGVSTGGGKYSTFTTSKRTKLGGNVNTLLTKTGNSYNKYYGLHRIFENATLLSEADDAELKVGNSDNMCLQMFKNSGIVDASWITIISVGSSTCREMFMNCTSLTTSTNFNLNGFNGGDQSFRAMFDGCSSLVNVSDIFLNNASSLGTDAFRAMFANCTSLVKAPKFRYTGDLSTVCGYDGSFQYMFAGCTSLTNVSGLERFPGPKQNAGTGTFQNMFSGCISLNSIPPFLLESHIINNIGRYCFKYMFINCTSLTTAPTLPATTLYQSCYESMFENCTSLVTAPTLPATTLETSCYKRMFYGCSSLNYINAAFTTTPSTNYTEDWVYGVAWSGTFVKNANATWTDIGTHSFPITWVNASDCGEDTYTLSNYDTDGTVNTAIDTGLALYNHNNNTFCIDLDATLYGFNETPQQQTWLCCKNEAANSGYPGFSLRINRPTGQQTNAVQIASRSPDWDQSILNETSSCNALFRVLCLDGNMCIALKVGNQVVNLQSGGHAVHNFPLLIGGTKSTNVDWITTRFASMHINSLTVHYFIYSGSGGNETVTDRDLSMYDVFDNSRQTRETANTYIVYYKGTHLIPLVYGNGIKNGTTNSAAYTNQGGANQANFVNHLGNTLTSPYIEQNTGCTASSVELLWQTSSIIDSVELINGTDCRMIRFNVNSYPFAGGLALIGIKDSNSNIIWSWLLWFDNTLTETSVTNSRTFLSKYLGDIGTMTGPYFQSGRKDPLIGAGTTLYNISGTSVTGYSTVTNNSLKTIPESIKRPTSYFTQVDATYSNWNNLTVYNNFWDAACNNYDGNTSSASSLVKTIYDPCPAGYIVPCKGYNTIARTDSNNYLARANGSIASNTENGCNYLTSTPVLAGSTPKFYRYKGYNGFNAEHRANGFKIIPMKEA